MSVVEAMLAGKPVLAHAAGGPADIVVDGVTGWHVAAPTPEAFAEGLQRMLRDRPRWPAMGQAGMQRAWRKYTHHAMTSQLLNVVSEKLHLP
jgi:glycosyltransferase involved in cell wall biosynthesis